MKRQLIAVGLAAVAALVLASISASLAAPRNAPLAQIGEAEPNDTFDDANPVPVPGYATGVITRSVSAADTDYFVINTQVGREYRARLSIWTAGNLKLQMNLYNGDRAYRDTSSSSSSYATMSWTAYQDTHYLQIEALNPNTTTLQIANYQLNIDEFAATPTYTPPPPPPLPPGEDAYEPNDSISEAYVLPISTWASATDANFYPLPDEDWYAFYVKEGRTYRATTSNLANVDTYLEVFHRDGSRVARDDDGGGGFASKVEWDASYSSDYYYIRVTNLAPTGDPDDTYDLIVYEVSPGTMRVWLPLCFRGLRVH